jgi:beta-phosphoglucomutase-like phosphatase (HAD superfamily)
MKLRYPCLVVDHDDTVVMSTPSIHYPAHLETMRKVRPGIRPVDIDTWFRKNFDPGIIEFLSGELGFSEQELETEFEVWTGFTRNRVPGFFPGMMELLFQFKRQGGFLVVVSHSEVEIIERDYRMGSEKAEIGKLVPDLVFGWDHDPERRKPHPYPLLETMRRTKFLQEEVLVLDDLRPGAEMAKAAGIETAGAGWGHDIREIREWMEANCRYYFRDVESFGKFLLEGTDGRLYPGKEASNG